MEEAQGYTSKVGVCLGQVPHHERVLVGRAQAWSAPSISVDQGVVSQGFQEEGRSVIAQTRETSENAGARSRWWRIPEPQT